MDLDNALHGHVVTAIFEVLLVDAGYQVIPLGVERSVRELRAVGEEQYLSLIHPRLPVLVPDGKRPPSKEPRMPSCGSR